LPGNTSRPKASQHRVFFRHTAPDSFGIPHEFCPCIKSDWAFQQIKPDDRVDQPVTELDDFVTQGAQLDA
jgi:hypothetical protein